MLVNGISVVGLGTQQAFDPNAPYKISDSDDAGDPSYFGNMATDGKWFILKINTVDKTYRYARGTTGYVSAWNNRASLAYDYFNMSE